MRRLHSTFAARVTAAAALAFAALPPSAAAQQAGRPSNFTVFAGATPIGSEQIAVERTAEGWTITSSGRLGPPMNLVSREVRIRYSADWHPLELTVDATAGESPLSMRLTVVGGSATTTFQDAAQTGERTDPIPPDAILLPSPFWGPFEALSHRLGDAPPGSTLSGYAGQRPFEIEVGESSEETFDTATGLVRARRTAVTLSTTGLPLEVAVWGDATTGRLLRLSIPAQGLEVIREDLASVAARRVVVARDGDEQVRIPATGFSLAGTISKPSTPATGRRPAVVLVGGSGATDRDEVLAGVPVFGQLADALADAGFLVLRYDRRGVGQSGGRPEAATLGDYADDLRAAVRLLSRRDDVDDRRVAVIGLGEGGATAMLTAAREDRVRALVLIGAMGTTGAEQNLSRVARTLERSNVSDAEKQETVALQKRLQEAVLTGQGWETVPEAMRSQADTPWFQSFLAFDPARVMRDVDQPLLIVHGLRDQQVAPSNADRLEELARARRRGTVDVVRLPDLNHVLAPVEGATKDDRDGARVSRAATDAIAQWLQQRLPPR
jgi:pimeloyl-ACP methyl ester carboxylesterase